MRKGIMIAIIALILIIGSAIAYAAQILKTDQYIFVYGDDAKHLDVYTKRDDGRYIYQGTKEWPLDQWREAITSAETQPGVEISEMISKEDANAKITVYGATPKPEPKPESVMDYESPQVPVLDLPPTLEQEETEKAEITKKELEALQKILDSEEAYDIQIEKFSDALDQLHAERIKQIEEQYPDSKTEHKYLSPEAKEMAEKAAAAGKAATEAAKKAAETKPATPEAAPTPAAKAEPPTEAQKNLQAAEVREAAAIKALESDPNNEAKQKELIAAKQNFYDAQMRAKGETAPAVTAPTVAPAAPEAKPAKTEAAPVPATGLQLLITNKIGSEQEVAKAKENLQKTEQYYTKTAGEYEAAVKKAEAALNAYYADGSETNLLAVDKAMREKISREEAANAALRKKNEAKTGLDDAEIALNQKDEEVNAEYKKIEAGNPVVAQARGRVASYQALIENQDANAKEQEAIQKKIDSLEEYVSGLEGEEGKEDELKKAKDNLEAEEKNLATKKTDAKGIKEAIEKQKPITNLDSANIRLAEIDREINELNVRTTAVAEEAYRVAQQERIDAENAIKNELEAPEVKAEYEQAKAIPEKDRTPAQQKAIDNYEYKLEEYTTTLAHQIAQEAKTKSEYEVKQTEAQKKARDLNKEKAEVQDAKETFQLERDIAQLDQELATDRAALAKAITDKTEDEKERLEKKIEENERKKEAKQNDLFLKENNWVARWAFIFMTDFMQGYEEYKGIGQWSSLWINDEDMAKKRQETAQKFCDEILGGVFGGTKCYQSIICEGLFPRDPPPAQNFLVTETSIGGYIPAASIQAEKSFPAMYVEAGKTKTKRVYKVTYFIENPHMDQELTYYIELRGDKTFKSEESKLAGRTLEKAGGKEGRLGSDPMIFESDSNYDNACLVFSPRIMKENGGYANEICAPIISYQGAATKPYTLPPATQAVVQNSTGTSTGVTMTGA